MSPSTVRIATRQSPLALWQTRHVAERLHARYPELHVELVPMTTPGDQILDQPLTHIGGKGLFLKTLEIAMLEGRADMAVHSLKDIPATLEPDFTLAAILPRADPADAFISHDYLHITALPHGARVGTSSPRRQAQLKAVRPDLTILDLRGNVGHRLSKLDDGLYDAMILAQAGLARLSMATRCRHRLEPPDWLPAPGQGAIAIETCIHHHSLIQRLKVLDDNNTRIAAGAERTMSQALGGNCSVSIGAWCQVQDQELHLYGMIGNAATGQLLRSDASAARNQPEKLGKQVATLLLDQGAGELLKAGTTI